MMATRIPTIIPPGLPAGEPEGELAPEAAAKLQTLRNRLAKRSVDHLGYPYNFDHAKHLGPLHDLLRFSLNNLGDPFDPSNYNVESREFEQEVIHIYAQLWGAKPGSYWGYVAHSGTEGNRLCMDKNGITLDSAKDLVFKAQGEVKLEAQGAVAVKGSKVDLQ